MTTRGRRRVPAVARCSADLDRLRSDDPAVWGEPGEVDALRARLMAGDWPGTGRLLRLDVPHPMTRAEADDALYRPGLGVLDCLTRERRSGAIRDYCAARGRDASAEWRADPAAFRAEFGSGVWA